MAENLTARSGTATPAVSVVVVSDFEAGHTHGWDDIRACVESLARQDFDEPAEFLLCEWKGFRHALPDDLASLLPGLRIVLADAATTFELKNEGVRQARGPLVAILDADCLPAPGWLTAAVRRLRDDPPYAAVCGRTLSPARDRRERIVALAGRAVGDEGIAAETRHLTVNNVAYRRDVYLRYPLSLAAGSCGHRLQTEAIRRSGGRLCFDPAMEVVHDTVTWDRERDVRRLMGQAIVLTRIVDPGQPYAWLVRLRYGSIPLFLIGKTMLTAWRCWRRREAHGVRWYEVPQAAAAGFVRHLLEVPGMIQAFRGRPIGTSRYR